MDLVIIHFKNSSVRFLFKTRKCSIIPLAMPQRPFLGLSLNRERCVERSSPTGESWPEGSHTPDFQQFLCLVPFEVFIPTAIYQSEVGVGEEMCLYEMGKDDCEKRGRRKNRGPGEGRSQTNRFQERVHMWGQKSGNLILLKLPTPAYSMESLCASPELCIFQCQVTWVSRLCERLKRQYTGDRTGFHSLAASPGLITASLNVSFLPVKGNCLAQRVTVRIKRHHACKAHLMSTWEAFDKWQLWLLPLLLLLLLFLRLLITICQGRALSYASHWFSSLLPVRIQISNEKRERGRQKAPEK